MTPTILLGGILIGFVVFVLGLVLSPSDDCLPPYKSILEHERLDKLDSRVCTLEVENRRLNHIVESMGREKRMFHDYMIAHCSKCQRNFYAPTPTGQKVADMLKDIVVSSEKIAEKLNIIVK